MPVLISSLTRWGLSLCCSLEFVFALVSCMVRYYLLYASRVADGMVFGADPARGSCPHLHLYVSIPYRGDTK